MKKTIITALFVVATVSAFSQQVQQVIPDTAVNLNSSNNQLYRLNSLFQFASKELLKSDVSVKDYVEFQKEYQELLSVWFKQKEEQVKQPTKKL